MVKKQTEPKLGTRSFRAWSINQEWLAVADSLGLNVSELINEVLEKHLKAELENKSAQIRKALSLKVS